MIWGHGAVKHSHGNGANRPEAGHTGQSGCASSTLHRHFGWLDGWPLILPSAGLALIAAILAVPRPTEPRWVPEPVMHPRILDAELARATALAGQARAQPLPFAVRELGEVYRRIGRTQYEVTKPFVSDQVQAWRGMLRTVQEHVGNQPVLQLRALQCELLVAAIHDWQSTGNIGENLIELGGDMVPLVRATHETLTEPMQWALALKRWTSLAGLGKQNDFSASREVELTQLHFFYQQPPVGEDLLAIRMHIVKRYADLDSSYPVDYAVGVLLVQSGRADTAATYFAKHLQLHPNGAFALRARNHLLWTARQLSTIDDDGPP
jgi:hypothetical protein